MSTSRGKLRIGADVFLSVAVALVGLLWLQHAVAVTSGLARAILKSAENAPTKSAVSTGTVVWSIVPAPSAQPSSVGVGAEITIPDLKMHAEIIFRRNLISSLPASHIIDMRLSFDAGSPISAVKDVAVMQMLRDDPAAADALTGFKAKISENHFLVGLTRGEDDETLNLKMITGRSWFKLSLQLNDGRVAELMFEKGAEGNQVISDAISAWSPKGLDKPSDPFVTIAKRDTFSNRRGRAEVPLLPIGRSFKVPAVINGRLQIEFLLDSGADYVSIPEDVVSTLKATGTLTEKDFSGSRMFVLADGSKVPGRTFFLHSLKVGGRVVEHVPSVVARVGAPLLLGQSFLKKFDAWSIDNSRRVLMLEGGASESAPVDGGGD